MSKESALNKVFPIKTEAQAVTQLRVVKKVHSATVFMRGAFPEVKDGYAKTLAGNRAEAKELVKTIRGYRQNG